MCADLKMSWHMADLQDWHADQGIWLNHYNNNNKNIRHWPNIFFSSKRKSLNPLPALDMSKNKPRVSSLWPLPRVYRDTSAPSSGRALPLLVAARTFPPQQWWGVSAASQSWKFWILSHVCHLVWNPIGILCTQVQQLCGSPSRRSAASVVIPHSRESVVFKPDARSPTDSLASRRR